MKKQQFCGLLSLFGEQVGDETKNMPVNIPQATGEQSPSTGEDVGSPAAEEKTEGKARKEEFLALMEGEYKDLFTEYFQETFNRRFREQKGMMQELEGLRAVKTALMEHLALAEGDDLLEAIRTENERKRASAEAEQRKAEQAKRETEDQLQRAVREAVESTRAETERELLSHIRARGLRPTESALTSLKSLHSGAARLSRAQRAEVARRAARGEHIEL